MADAGRVRARDPQRKCLGITGVLLAAICLTAALPASGNAALITFGSHLLVHATRNTNNLKYQGINTPFGNKVFHTAHDGADTALWNTKLSAGRPTAPANGQVRELSLEGCAQPARGGPAPLTQIHFQTLVALSKGAVEVALTSQAFEIPVCGQHGASGSTVSTYKPDGLCISKGDYVDFNDEGGYVENVYHSGVPYKVMGLVGASEMNSFVLAGGTNNGATLSPTDVGQSNGFAVNRHEELMLRATLGTGHQAIPGCRGGLRG
jgi:hypothetical protein